MTPTKQSIVAQAKALNELYEQAMTIRVNMMKELKELKRALDVEWNLTNLEKNVAEWKANRPSWMTDEQMESLEDDILIGRQQVAETEESLKLANDLLSSRIPHVNGTFFRKLRSYPGDITLVRLSRIANW